MADIQSSLLSINNTVLNRSFSTPDPAHSAVVNCAFFCHTYLHRIQGRTNVLPLQQSEKYKRHRPETTLLNQLVER